MSRPFLRLAIWLVRAWSAVYTWGLPAAVRHARRAELDSDLWESQQGEDSNRWLPLQIVARLLLGAVDDLMWRTEQPAARLRLVGAGLALAVTASVVLLAIWMGVRAQHTDLPRPVVAPDLTMRSQKPPPPPPPPPPPLCNPPGSGRPVISPCSPY